MKQCRALKTESGRASSRASSAFLSLQEMLTVVQQFVYGFVHVS